MSSKIDLSTYGATNPRSTVALAEDGRNFIAWKTVLSITLQAEQFAWEVTTGTLVMPEVKDGVKPTPEQEKTIEQFNLGNRKAKSIIINSLHTPTIVNLFYGQVANIDADDIWNKIDETFNNKTGIMKDQAITKFMAFRFQPNLSIQHNLNHFQTLMYTLDELQASIDRKMACARLIDALPRDWEPFKLAWGTKTHTEKSLPTLIEMISAESARRGSHKTSVPTALFSRMSIGRGKPRHFRKPAGRRPGNFARPPPFSKPPQFPQPQITCYNCGKQGHISRNCKAPRKDSRGRGSGTFRPNNSRSADVNFSEVQALMSHSCDEDEIEDLQNNWVLDSGSSHHITNSRDWFVSYSTLVDTRDVRVGSRHTLKALGVGTVTMAVQERNTTQILNLDNVLYVPNMRRNLISIGKLTDDGFTVTVCDAHIQFSKDAECILSAGRDNGLYTIYAAPLSDHDPGTQNASNALQTELTEKVSLREAHRALAHIHIEKVKKYLVDAGIQFQDDLDNCTACMKGKLHKASYKGKPKESLATRIGTFHTDLCSPPEVSLGGSKHMLCLTDEYSSFRKLYFLKSKDETPDHI